MTTTTAIYSNSNNNTSNNTTTAAANITNMTATISNYILNTSANTTNQPPDTTYSNVYDTKNNNNTPNFITNSTTDSLVNDTNLLLYKNKNFNVWLNQTINTFNQTFNNSTNTTNTTNTTGPIDWELQRKLIMAPPYNSTEIIQLCAFFLILIIGTLGNGYIYYYFGLRKKKIKRTIPELLFSYLAIFDFSASVLNPILYINFTLNRQIWTSGEFLCKTALTLGACVTTISGGIFIIIALDRERCIVYPFKSHFQAKTIKICVAAAIVYACVINFHYAMHLTVMPGILRCTVPDVSYISYWLPTIITFVIQDLTLMFVFAFTNMRIFEHLKASSTSLALGAFLGRRKRESAKIIRLLVVLATVFFILTLPRDIFICSQMMSWVIGSGFDITLPIQKAYYFIKVLHTANSSVNFFIYFHMHRGFNRYVKQNPFCCFFSQYSHDSSSNSRNNNIIITDDFTRSTDPSPKIFRKFPARKFSSASSNKRPAASMPRSSYLATQSDISVNLRMINDVINSGRKKTIN